MKKSAALAAAMLLLLPLASFAAGKGDDILTRIAITFEGGEAVVALYDTPASQDLLTMLPLDLEFEDFAGTEKIAYPPRRLHTAGSPSTRELPGDFTCYTPWGNLAVFYKGQGSDNALASLGRIESGKDRLAAINGGFKARIEVVGQ